MKMSKEEAAARGIKDMKDFEADAGGNRRYIFEGHPGWCPIQERHEPHDFVYRHWMMNEIWIGRYHCDGRPFPFAKREDL